MNEREKIVFLAEKLLEEIIQQKYELTGKNDKGTGCVRIWIFQDWTLEVEIGRHNESIVATTKIQIKEKE